MNRLLTATLILALALLASSCGGSADPAADAGGATTAAESSTGAESYPVEALPDPLPDPYLFRDEITIEEPEITETIYVVQPGDTLAGIADGFCITLAEVQRLNNIVDVASLSIGQELRIPIREGGCGVAAPQTTDEPAEQAEPVQPPGEVYIVEPGDTLAEIGAAFGFTWRDLMSYNGLTEAQAGNLQVGQTLIIPPPPDPEPEQVEEEGTAEETGSSEPPG